jgi:hypothetical protein
MIVVSIKDARTNYILTAELNAAGDLVLSASDFSAMVKEMFSTDEYEYFYTVKAANVAKVLRALNATQASLLDKVRELLAPHDVDASTRWKAWLVENKIPYDFSVWR